MRVLAVAPNYPPESRVGAWMATHGFMRHLLSLGHDVTAVTITSTGDGWTHEGVPVHTCRRGRSFITQLAHEHDVVVSHHGDGGVGARAARKAGKPSVQMVHGFIHRAPASADLLVFNSHSNKAVFEHDIPSIVCHPPTDFDQYITQPGKRVTLVNLSELKGGGLFDRVSRAMPDHEFLGVRGGYGVQIVPRHPNVEVIGTTKNMREHVYGRTRVLLMPSQHETWGMVGIEAMASGIPVIAHPTPGLRESLGDAGIFVDREDGEAWVAAIRMLDDPDVWAEWSAKAKARVVEVAELIRAGLDRFVVALEALCALSSESRFELALAAIASRRGNGSVPI